MPRALHLAGTEFAGRLARSDRGRPRRHALPQPWHWGETGAMGRRRGARHRLPAGRTAHASYPRRCAAILQTARISAEPCRDDIAVLIWLLSGVGLTPLLQPLRNGFRHSFRLTRDKLIGSS